MIYKISKLPPSSNNMFGINRTRGEKAKFISKRYQAWIDLAIRDISPIIPLDCTTYAFEARIPEKMKRYNADLDNYIKPLVDLMVRTGATPDDVNCVDFRIFLTDTDMIEVEVRPWRTIHDESN